MPHSLLDRQLATIQDTLRESDQHRNLRDSASRRAEVTPVTHNSGSDNTVSITARSAYEDSERTVSVSQSESMHAKQHALTSNRDIKDLSETQRMISGLWHYSPGGSGSYADEVHAQKAHVERAHADAESDSTTRADMCTLVETKDEYGTFGDNPKTLLLELNRRYWALKGSSGIGHNETGPLADSEATLEDVKEKKQTLGLSTYQGTACGPRTALEGSTAKDSPYCSLAPQHTLRNSVPAPASHAATSSCQHSGPVIADALDPKTTPYAVALMLEGAGCQWEEVKDWTLFLFSNGIEGYRAKQAKEQFDAIVAYARHLEGKKRAAEKCQFASRLIVSNIAADADRMDIYHFFTRCQKDIREIILLSERDAIKRTRTAYVDMSCRKAAVRASFEFGHIFGLAVRIKLAVE